MKILHYALGFPPYRTGGLTKYCMDLMIAQKEQGDEVALLWPGKIGLLNHKLSIKKGKDIENIQNFEIINPLPVALDEGITEISSYIASADIEVYRKLLDNYKPDVIHLHTLMGLHKEFLVVAKDLGIKTVFTTHDYYGLCPKVTFFYKGNVCDNDNGCRNCIECNQSSLSIQKIMLLQSPLYRSLKDFPAIKILRRRHRSEVFEGRLTNEIPFSITQAEQKKKSDDYLKLREYYINMYNAIDVIHFNSSVTESIYKRYLNPRDGRIISITHRGISDHRKKKEFSGKLKITYLAPAKPFKGFDILKKALDELWEEGCRDFELNIYSFTNKISPYIHMHEPYEYNELENIFDKTDILVAPSLWYETFGLTALEALSYGVPVIVSENVGAKDLIYEKELGIIVKPESNEIYKNIKKIIYQRECLKQWNDNICKIPVSFFSNSEHMKQIQGIYNN